MSAGTVRQIALDGESLTPSQLAAIADGDVQVPLAAAYRGSDAIVQTHRTSNASRR